MIPTSLDGESKIVGLSVFSMPVLEPTWDISFLVLKHESVEVTDTLDLPRIFGLSMVVTWRRVRLCPWHAKFLLSR